MFVRLAAPSYGPRVHHVTRDVIATHTPLSHLNITSTYTLYSFIIELNIFYVLGLISSSHITILLSTNAIAFCHQSTPIVGQCRATASPSGV